MILASSVQTLTFILPVDCAKLYDSSRIEYSRFKK